MEFEGRDIISIKDFSREEISYIFEIAKTNELCCATMNKSPAILQLKILSKWGVYNSI